MEPEIVAGERMSAKIAKAFDAAISPDTYAVLHLRRELDGCRGERQLYEREALGFMARLSKRVRGKATHRRLPPDQRFLPNAITIEKLFDGPHLNVMLRRPANWEFDAFEAVLREEWLKSPWAATDQRAVKIMERERGSNLVGYCHKEGDEALLIETLSFGLVAAS
ncbi:hypothetical protein [Sphingomonas alba]|uniref:Uncharacterized protein n=1 Tax=Sphingomonas alba TaxID=2908208 RepID=A0ABT0RN90_9SPHN|nr:hypothetical protein [Sphingomonas alba]MCL6684098.1 hypothetical protein [Sphingomonas alba]